MAYEYFDDFQTHVNGEHPDGWLVEQHTARRHLHGCAQDGAYAILTRGNKHIPHTPPLRNFTLAFGCHGDPGAAALTIYIIFRYNRETQTGYFIRRKWGREEAITEFGLIQNNVQRMLASHKSEEVFGEDKVGVENHLRLEARDFNFRLYHNEIPVGAFRDAEQLLPEPGLIAFDRGRSGDSGSAYGCGKSVYALKRTPGVAIVKAGARGPLFLRQVRIVSDESFARQAVWPPFTVPFPPEFNGLASPYYFHVEASKLGGRIELRARLTGGPNERREPLFDDYKKYQLWMNEQMLNPYLRLETRDGVDLGKYYLFQGTVGLRENWDRHATAMPPAQAECPLEQTIILPALPADVNLFLGYEYYEAEERQILKGGPTEILVDPLNGNILYGGPIPSDRNCWLELHSGAGKTLCGRIPQTDKRHVAALAFAKTNHYFYEDEPIRFNVLVRCRPSGIEKETLKASVRLLNVFREPMEEWRDIVLSGGADESSAELHSRLGIDTLVAAIPCPRHLLVGVYHMDVRLEQAGHPVAAATRAFEIMPGDPAKPSAPLASGLPELYCTEFFEFFSSADAFDPWVGKEVDEYHYVSGNVFDAQFARRYATWNILRLYRRRWLLWMMPYFETGAEPGKYRDLIPRADLVYSGANMLRFDLWLRSSYARREGAGGLAFERLLDFLGSDVFRKYDQGGLSRETVAARGNLTKDEFRILVTRHWKDWLDYFNRWYSGEYAPAEQKRMRSLAPAAIWGWFGPYPPYGSVYKSAYFARYMGRDFRMNWHRVYTGPMRFESYPLICGYPIQRDVFMLASMKLEAPDMKLYPEVYGLVACPMDGHVMLGSPPYGRIRAPARSFPKRFFEYAYAAVWFDGTAYRYWQDNGFQPTHWDRTHFAALLSAWATIGRVRPLKPARTTAFVYSRKACMNHPDYYESRPAQYMSEGKPPAVPDDIFNTAEEAIAFAYEQARLDGQSAGFLTELDYLGSLNHADVDTLVLPPLSGLSPKELQMIRRRHEDGMNLMAFEDISGLEDLFGVASIPQPAAIEEIYVHPDCKELAPWRELGELRERTTHPLCQSRYGCKGADPLLMGLTAAGDTAPVLVTHKTQWGRTALFTIPPTVVRREDAVHTYGSASLSRLMNRAMAIILRQLGSPAVETTAGKLIVFWDTQGKLRIIVEEDASPDQPSAIQPRLTIRLPNRTIGNIVCDRKFALLTNKHDEIRLRLDLEPDECALFTVEIT